jgi:hypothetical protein
MLQKWDVNGPEKDNEGALVPVYSLEQYLGQPRRLSIPPWQREYSWLHSDKGDGEVNALLDDLASFVRDKNRSEYLIGAVILCPSTSKDQMYVIDGQQRTVTFSLLLMCCLKYMTAVLKDNEDFVFLNRLHSCYDRGTSFKSIPSVSFSQEKANEIMQAIRAWMVIDSDDEDKRLQDNERLSQTQKNLLAVVKVFYKVLKDGSWLSTEELKPALEKILTGVKVLQLVLDDERSAIEVYDRINNRGRHLSGGDLVKNLMFQAVPDELFDTISDHWTDMVQTLQKTKLGKLQEPTFLMRSIAWTLENGKPAYDALPDLFSKRFNKDLPADHYLEPVKFAEDLADAASALVEFVDLNHRKHGSLPELQVAQHLGSVQHYSVLLAGEKIKGKGEFLHLYSQVARRTAVYIFSQERPPEFESIVNKWAVKVRAAGPNVTIEQLNEIFESEANFKPAMVSQMKANVLQWNYRKGSDKKKIRAALALMSWWLDAKDPNGTIQDYFRTKKLKGQKLGWDIDHIDATKNNDSTLDEDTKNLIGNLVLLCPSDNRASGSVPPNHPDKTNSYAHSKIILTKSLGSTDGLSPAIKKRLSETYAAVGSNADWSLDKWNSAAVENRSQFYADLLEFILVSGE